MQFLDYHREFAVRAVMSGFLTPATKQDGSLGAISSRWGEAVTSKITATFDVVTPLFLGGADPSRVVELRAPSIKGALRFWWRALAWSRHGGDLNAIRKEEQTIFGAAGDDHNLMGRASFGLRVRWLSEPRRLVDTKPSSLTSKKPGSLYLSYGIINRGQGNLPRPCYEAEGRFELTIHALGRTAGKSALHESLPDAVKLLGLLGGLGGRSRRGWGSVALTELQGDEDDPLRWQPPRDLAKYGSELSSILGSTADTPTARYSAFGECARLFVFGVGDDAMALLDELGRAYQAFRRERDNRSFIFGLPHSRFGGAARRASPLLFHIHKLNDQYALAVTILRAPFLEDQPHWEEYKKVERFLDQLSEEPNAAGLKQALGVLTGGAVP